MVLAKILDFLNFFFLELSKFDFKILFLSLPLRILFLLALIIIKINKFNNLVIFYITIKDAIILLKSYIKFFKNETNFKNT